ncbi:sensor histidine kinase [Kineococcus sp. SYSU DK005]|uniref:sensor histidine kinase n=1 Tax=Kineococcus sp. SYSU DK005 TaxID=3383126 RepID=UPI003D7D95CC
MDHGTRDGAESARLAALHERRLLEAPADEELAAVVRVAAEVTGARGAALEVVGEHRARTLSAVGREALVRPRAHSLCALHLHRDGFVHVADAAADPRFRGHPLVDGRLGAVRCYAAAPLTTPEGHVLGALWVFDERPRALGAGQVGALRDLARLAAAAFERRLHARLEEQHAAEVAEQRALAEVTMAEAEARCELQEAVLELIDVGIVVVEPDGRVAMSNRAARQVHGLEADPGVDPEEFPAAYRLFAADGVTPLPVEEVPMRRVLREGEVRRSELVIAPSGRSATVAIADGRALHRGDGSSLGAVVALHDVTAVRTREAALERADAELADKLAALEALQRCNGELERSNHDLEQFAGTASHDLNAPLVVVSGYLEMLRDVHGDALGEEGREWIATALRSTGRMAELIASLLCYARSGGCGVRRERTDVAELHAQVVLDLRGRIEGAGARVSAAHLPRVLGDPVLLRQLLQNLVANAVQHRSPLRPCRVHVSAERGADGWTVSVADNGTGIPAEHRERVFEVFAQVDPSARTGHGIGLATCRRVVARHGGRIWVEETPGGGTTVRFTLPQP